MPEIKETQEKKENFPVVKVVCTHCQQEFEGKIGPIHPDISYALHEYTKEIVGDNKSAQISHWNLKPEERSLAGILLTHHNTVRSAYQGHHLYNVFSENALVGVIRVSTGSQIFSSDAVTMSLLQNRQ